MRFLTILLLLPVMLQAQTKTPFATTPTPVANRFAYTNNGLWVDSTVRLMKYAGASGLAVDANGYVIIDTNSTVTLPQLNDSVLNYKHLVNIMSFGATPNYIDSTDDDAPAIQAAINYAFTLGEATVYTPRGRFDLRSPLVKNVGIHTVNAQLYIPYNPMNWVDSTAPRRVLTFLFDNKPLQIGTALNVDYSYINRFGSYWQSHILNDGSTFPSVISQVTADCQSPFGLPICLNGVQTHFVNAHIIVKYVPVEGAQLSGIDMRWSPHTSFEFCKINTDTSLARSDSNSLKSFGIRASVTGSGNLQLFDNTMVNGFYHGIISGEHTIFDNTNVIGCNQGYTLVNSSYPVEFRNATGHWNKIDVSTDDFMTGISSVNIYGSMRIESIDDLFPDCCIRTYNISDTGNRIKGILQYYVTDNGNYGDSIRIRGGRYLTHVWPFSNGTAGTIDYKITYGGGMDQNIGGDRVTKFNNNPLIASGTAQDRRFSDSTMVDRLETSSTGGFSILQLKNNLTNPFQIQWASSANTATFVPVNYSPVRLANRASFLVGANGASANTGFIFYTGVTGNDTTFYISGASGSNLTLHQIITNLGNDFFTRVRHNAAIGINKEPTLMLDGTVASGASVQQFGAITLTAGYTGTTTTAALSMTNSTAGTGTSILTNLNKGALMAANASTSGVNVGAQAAANNSSLANIGTLSQTVVNSAGNNTGVYGKALNGAKIVGIFGALEHSNATPAIDVSAAGIFDNGATTNAILSLQDGGTSVTRFIDGGGIGLYKGVVPANRSILQGNGTEFIATTTPVFNQTTTTLTYFPVTTEPAAPATGGVMWSETGGTLKYKKADGSVTTLVP